MLKAFDNLEKYSNTIQYTISRHSLFIHLFSNLYFQIVTEMYIRHNQIGDQGIRHLSNALKYNTVCIFMSTKLYLSHRQ